MKRAVLKKSLIKAKPMQLKTAWTLALRESRGGLHAMRLMLLALMLGVAVISTIGVLRESLFTGIERDAKRILGGDVSFARPYRPLTETERAAMTDYGIVSEVMEMRVMASLKQGKESHRRLVELKGVDGKYPLYGEVEVEPYATLPDVFALKEGAYGAAVDPAVLKILKAKLGDVLDVGSVRIQIRALLTREPDRVVNTYALGPRVLVSRDAFQATGLVVSGSLVSYYSRLRLKQGFKEAEVVAAMQQNFPNAGWRITGYKEVAPRLKEMLERLQRYISLIGLAVLLTAGMGIANAAQAWLNRRQETIAVFKCIGATRKLIWTAYTLQLVIASGVAALLGLAIGWFAPRALLPLLSGLLPVTSVWQPSALLFTETVLFALLVALSFSFWPLLRAASTRPAQILRGAVEPDRLRFQPWHAVAYALMFAGLTLLAASITGGIEITLYFAIGIALAFLLLFVLAWALQQVASSTRRRGSLVWRYALANLSRPGAPTRAVMLSLGMGTALMVAVTVLEFNLSHQLGDGVPKNAPAFFFLDIPSSQTQSFEKDVNDIAGTSQYNAYPTLRGRIVAIKDVPVEKARISPKVEWAIQGDRVLTSMANAPNDKIVQGKWWEVDLAEPHISISQDLAEGMGLSVGDKLRFDIMGSFVDARIANIREVDWRNYRMNFAIIFAPGVLEKMPMSSMATVEATTEAEEKILTNLSEAYPAVAMVRLREALQEVSALVDNIAAVVNVVAVFALAMGLLVMVTAVRVSLQRRMLDHTLLKVLGATRPWIVRVLGMEFLVMGVVAALAAGALGVVISFLMVDLVLKTPFVLPVPILLLTVGLVVPSIIAIGLAATWHSLKAKPLAILRNE